MIRKSTASCLFLLGILLARSARANVGQAYGFGSRAAALGGAEVAESDEGFLAYTNPGALGVRSAQRLSLSYGILLMQPSFTSIHGVVIENKYTSDKTADVVGDVDTDYRATLGQEIGITFHLAPDFANLTFGFATFLPFDPVAAIDSGDAYEPEYVLYRSRTQRPQFEFGLGADLGAGFHAGVGLHVSFGDTNNATALLQGDPNKPSSMRVAASLKPKAAPSFGVQYSRKDQPLSGGLVVRLPVAAPHDITVNAGARVFGGVSALDFDLHGASTLFYDPLSVELGTTLAEPGFGRTLIQVDYQAWSKFKSPALSIDQTTTGQCGQTQCGVVISPSANPSYAYRDIVVPRIGQEYELSELVILRAGYFYQPGIFKQLPTEAGNYLDPSKHGFSAGVGFRFKSFLGYDVPSTLDVHGAYEALVAEHVDKSPGNEAGDTSDRKVGDGGYDAGGKIVGGGLTLSLAF